MSVNRQIREPWSAGRVLWLVAKWTLLVALIATMLLPLLNTLALSFSTPRGSMQPRIVLWPDPFSIDGYETLFQRINIMRPLINNTYVTVVNTLVHVFIAALAGYSLSRRPFPGRTLIIGFILITMMIPFEGIMIPSYLVYRDLGLINKLTAVIMAGLVSGFSILLLKNFFDGVPRALAESAELDGANDWVIFSRIYLPVSLAGVVTVTLFQFVSKWNHFLDAVLFLNDTRKYTLQVALKNLIIDSDITSTTDSVSKNAQMAGVVISVLPLVLLYIFLQRYFMAGVFSGAVKE